MPHRATPRRADGLLALATADALWAELTAISAVRAASGAFTRPPAHPPAGYVLLGKHAVPTVKGADGRWHVPETDVRTAAAELSTVTMNGEDLVRVAPFQGSPDAGNRDRPAPRWRHLIGQEWIRTRSHPGLQPSRHSGSDQLPHLAGIDWGQAIVKRTQARAADTWWLPRTLVQLLDAAGRTEAQWLLAARRCQGCGAAADQCDRWRVQVDGGWQTLCPGCRTTTLRRYDGQWEGHVYAALSKKRSPLEVSGWMCALCQEAPASVLDHCHEHGYVRAPLCQPCNTRERPNYLYSNDVHVTSRYADLFHARAEDWLKHWHRCPGCRARTTLPLPHLAALTALLVGEPLRPTHRNPHSSRGRKPCGELCASWTGSHNTPASCLITLALDSCPSGEHRTLAQVPYRQAVDQFRTWLAKTAPSVATAAGPGRHDNTPTHFRPVIADTSSEDLALF
ncbi:endonuclease domain-containing protein [Streptacidiphilus sp. EB129]|uniref:endonuclease domain-containing protein n=1 Tax=Streptacidiphilus sp. EB129 TaxID=3156262 RepID=UPI003511D2E4